MPMDQNNTVIGIFEDQNQAAQAVDELRQAGFSDQQVEFVYREGVAVVTKTDSGIEDTTGTAVDATGRSPEDLLTSAQGPTADDVPTAALPIAEQATDISQGREEHPYESSAEENQPQEMASSTGEAHYNEKGAVEETVTDTGKQLTENQTVFPAGKQVETARVKGVLTGGIIGGVLGAAVALLIPALGLTFAGGLLVTVFSIALGVIAGGLLGTIVAHGIPEEDASQYQSELKPGRTIVTVKTDHQKQEALDILCRNEAWYANKHE